MTLLTPRRRPTGHAGAAECAVANVNLPATIERIGTRLRLRPLTSWARWDTDHDFSADPGAWTIENPSKATAVANPTAESGILRVAAASVASGQQNYWSGTHTAWGTYRTFKHRPGVRRMFGRTRINFGAAATGEEGVRIGFRSATSRNNGHFFDLGYLNYFDGGTVQGYRIRAALDGSTTDVAITEGQAEAGVWWMIEVDGGRVGYFYDLTDDGTAPHLRATPGTWTRLAAATQGALAAAGEESIEVGFWLNGHNNAAADHVVDMLHWNTESMGSPELGDPASVHYSDEQQEIQLIDDLDIGGGARIATADLRAALQGAESNLGHERATWQWMAVRSPTTGADTGDGTWRASTAAVVDGVGRYLSVWARADSDGTEAGSLDTAALRIRIT